MTFSIYPIIDSSFFKTALDIVKFTAEILRYSPPLIQFRAKGMKDLDFYDISKRIKDLIGNEKTKLIINDRIDIALLVDADGAHIGQDDFDFHLARKLLKNKILGVSTHTLLEAKKALECKPDYIGFGPVFQTETKKNAGLPKGINELRQIVRATKIPVAAIGGINPGNIELVKSTGARYGAVASAIIHNGSIETSLFDSSKV